MTIKHTEVFMVRHGQTASNIAGLFHGATDVPLNDMGIRQAELVADRVSSIENLNSLHSSPLQRAMRTAMAISRRIGLEPRIHAGLAEMDFGEAEGMVLAAMTEKWPDLARRFEDLSDHNVRFPGGESRSEFHTRVRETLDNIVATHSGERILVVAHGGVIASLVAQIVGGDPNDWRRYRIDNCSVTHIELATDGPVTHLMNDIVHLERIDLPDAGEGTPS